MTEQDPKTAKLRRSWHHAVAGGALALGLLVGFGSAIAHGDPAEPADPASQSDTPPKQMTAEQALAIIEADYDTGAGGGQLSNLIHEVLTLRAQGFMPSSANKEAIVKALDYRPNQTPLVRALQETISYQQKKQAQAQQTETPFTIGINQYDPENPGVLGTFGINPGSAGTINQPVG